MAKGIENKPVSRADFRVNEQTRETRSGQLICLVLGIVTIVAYLPAVHHDFLAYDDQEYVTQNWQVLRGLTWKGVLWAFGFHAANWHPLTWISHMLDCQVFGLRPWGHHLTNAVLHAANAVLLFVGLRTLVSSQWSVVSGGSAGTGGHVVPLSRGLAICACAFVAAVFAWHPLHVESVAWVAERKDVLSGLFFMLTLLAYARYASSPNRTSGTGAESVQHSVFSIQNKRLWYVLALVFFALALMSKPMVVTVPFLLLLLDFWPLGRFSASARRCSVPQHSITPSLHHSTAPLLHLVFEKLPFFAMSAVGCALTMLAQYRGYAIVSRAALPLSERTGHAAISYVHYVAAHFWPRHLSVFYPYERAGTIEVVLCALLLVAITAAAIWFARRLPYLFVGWFWFLGMLVPVIGLVQVGEQARADRYTYLPSIGLFIAVAWGVSEIALRKKLQTPNSKLGTSKFSLRALAVFAGIAALGLIAAMAVQLGYWRNTRTLFEHAETVTGNNYMAIALLGSLDAAEGHLEDAIERYQRALRIRPGYAEAHYLLGDALDKQGKTNEAINEFRQALRFKPMQFQTQVSLGVALAKQGKFDEAAQQYRAALNINPESSLAHNNLARVLHSEGRLDDAIEHYRAALKYDSNLAEAHNNLGALLSQKGNIAEGIAELREALRLNGGNPQTALNLALALSRAGQWSEAAQLFERTAGKVAWDANAHYRFGVVLERDAKPKEAMREYASALLMQPDFPDALAALAWILATSPRAELRNGTEAERMAERACQLTERKDARKLIVLAAAYAEAQRFQEAVATVATAQQVATTLGNKELTDECILLAEAFKSASPWRTSP